MIGEGYRFDSPLFLVYGKFAYSPITIFMLLNSSNDI